MTERDVTKLAKRAEKEGKAQRAAFAAFQVGQITMLVASQAGQDEPGMDRRLIQNCRCTDQALWNGLLCDVRAFCMTASLAGHKARFWAHIISSSTIAEVGRRSGRCKKRDGWSPVGQQQRPQPGAAPHVGCTRLTRCHYQRRHRRSRR